MSSDPVGILATACCNICAGIVLDFISLRHGCTATLCNTCCDKGISMGNDDDEPDERAQLVSTQPPAKQPSMGVGTLA
ncbi:hypothetical protein BDN72DRAFT_847391 [Pluteus cervinus]|uniref:Uncharacterized protein n=1 Tax=Pluteus cervinus TaxID=181527 RepID=A0ACD3AD40_9AGAR|nr:hypothetical protein BDN72DRAFT_847391 [Pluteus cervinus]